MMLKVKLNNKIENNFNKVKIGMMIPALILIIGCIFFYFANEKGGNYKEEYAGIQKEMFYYLNGILSLFPDLQINLTQLGDILIFFSLISIFLIFAPKLWEGLLTSALLSLLVSTTLKKIFAIPRPASMYDEKTFTIIGETLTSHNSLPSGHSISTFVVMSTLLFGFMPKKMSTKIIWIIFMVMIGFIISFSRVGVGAHYPIDVIIGSAIGYLVTVLGIIINNKIGWLKWLSSQKCYPYFLLLLLVWIVVIIFKITTANLLIFYFSILALLITSFYIIRNYVQRN